MIGEKFRRFDVYLAFLFVILLIVFNQYFKENFLLQSSDDIPYLNAANYLQYPITNTYIGPFYPLYLKLFLVVFKNPIEAYQNAVLSYGMLLGTIFIFFIFKRERSINSFVILFLVFFLLNPKLFGIFPKISFFCCLLVFICLYLLENRSWNYKFYVLLSTSFLLSYTRPEFYVSFLFIYLVGIFYLVNRKLNWIPFLILGLFFALLGTYLLGGIPLGSRGLDAFKQHFIINYLKWHPGVTLGNNPKAEFELFDKVFGQVTSMPQLLFENPSYFLKHIGQNVLTLMGLCQEILISGLKFFSQLIGLPIILWGLLLVILLLNIDFRASWKGIRPKGKIWFKSLILPYLLLIFPSIVSLILIYPREHYFLFIAYFILLVLILISLEIKFKSKLLEGASSLILMGSICLLAIFPNRMHFAQNKLIDLTQVFTKMQQLGNNGQNTFYSPNLFEPIFFRKYYKNNENIDITEANLLTLKPDVIFFKYNHLDELKSSKLPIYKDYRVDNRFSNQNILIFTKKNLR